MRVELREYQETAVEDLLYRLDEAGREVRRRPQTRAIAFSAPTGAGKTVMMAATIEEMIVGGEYAARAGVAPDPDLTFLWISDRPDLNDQSRRRISDDANRLAADRFVTIENNFDRETLEPGTIYFLNFQKLRTGSLLTRIGDDRAHTIWEIIAETQSMRPGKLVVVIDEAHRGLGIREEQEANTIAANFVRGGTGDLTIRGPQGSTVPFPPVQIVVGISATPERFTNYLTTEGGRVRADVPVPPSAVRVSGLIKDTIILLGQDDADDVQESVEWTLLKQACLKIQEMETAWDVYAHANQPMPPVYPALVIQVEDKAGSAVTATSLELLIDTLRTNWPSLEPAAIAHCFMGVGDLTPVQGWSIQHREPSELTGDTSIRVILFKTALNTGWDCPRAEVMMSFRTLHDRTAIAQLVGRMVRTPLANRVPGDTILNSTFLYLPKFDEQSLRSVKTYLTSDAPEISSEVVESREIQALELRPNGQSIYDLLKSVPTEVVAAERPMPDIRRLLKLCRLLEQDGLATDATHVAVSSLTGILENRIEALEGNADFEQRIVRRATASITSLTIQDGEVRAEETQVADISDADVERAFRATSALLGDEVGLEWLRRRYNEENPLRAKLEFLEVIGTTDTLDAMQADARTRFQTLQQDHLGQINALPDGRRDLYVSIQRSGRSVQRSLMAPERRVFFPLKADAVQENGHLYIAGGTAEQCLLDLNGWERAVLAQERQRQGFIAFLRNLDRKRWSLSYAYDYLGVKPGYPDFLLFREEGGELIVDILEPHQGEDAVAKAKGMSDFAGRYGEFFGRVQMIRMMGGHLRRLNLHEAIVRDELDIVESAADLIGLFDRLGVVG